VALQINKDTKPPIVDTLFTLIFTVRYGAYLCSFQFWRKLIYRKQTMMYQCRYFKINCSISKSDLKCDTWNTELEIRKNESSQTLQYLRVDGYGAAAHHSAIIYPNWNSQSNYKKKLVNYWHILSYVIFSSSFLLVDLQNVYWSESHTQTSQALQ